MTVLKRILGFFTTIFAIVYFATASSQEMPTLNIVLGVLMLVFTVLLFRPTKKDKQKREKCQQETQDKLQTCTMKHINGLPIAENMNCTITSTPCRPMCMILKRWLNALLICLNR